MNFYSLWSKHESSNQLKDICHGSSGWNTQRCLVKTTSCIMHGRQSSCLDPFQSTVIHLPNPSNIGIISCFFRICYQKMQTLNFPGERLLKQFNSLSSSSKLSLSLHCHLAVPKHRSLIGAFSPILLVLRISISQFIAISLDLWLNHLRINLIFPKWATNLSLAFCSLWIRMKIACPRPIPSHGHHPINLPYSKSGVNSPVVSPTCHKNWWSIHTFSNKLATHWLSMGVCMVNLWLIYGWSMDNLYQFSHFQTTNSCDHLDLQHVPVQFPV